MTNQITLRAPLLALALILSLVANQTQAVPSSISYQGYLTDAAGVAVTDTLSVTFGLSTLR